MGTDGTETFCESFQKIRKLSNLTENSARKSNATETLVKKSRPLIYLARLSSMFPRNTELHELMH